MIGETLSGRFRVERLLGRGGMSAVWLARDDELERHVAVKLLHSRRLESADAVERFEREARTLASLAHPGIVTVIDRGEHDGRPYIVCEYVDGHDLREHISEGPMPTAVALAVCAQVAEALSYAHAHGVIHRDVKPHNVLLTDEGVAKLTDFGIARILEEPSLTQTGRVLGTGEYLAPEQVTGGPFDERADVYGLGVMLYHCLCGEPPYRGTSFVEIAEQHLRAPVPRARAMRPDLPPRVDAIMARALAKRPDDRYPSCQELAADLEDALERETAVNPDDTAEIPVVAQALRIEEDTPPSGNPRILELPRPVPQEPPHRDRRRRLPVVLLCAVVLVGAAWAAYFVFGTGGTSPARTAGGPATRPVARDRTATVAVVPQPVAASAYDPAGDGSENGSSAPLAVDGNPATWWSTEHYEGSEDVNGKGGVGLILDAGAAVPATRLRLRTPPDGVGWRAEVFRSDGPTAPTSIAGWTAASRPFAMDAAQETIPLTGTGRARLYLVWITRLVGGDGGWSARIADVTLLRPKAAASPDAG